MQTRIFLFSLVCLLVLSGCTSLHPRPVREMGNGFRAEVTAYTPIPHGQAGERIQLVYVKQRNKTIIWPTVVGGMTAPGWVMFDGYSDDAKPYRMAYSVRAGKIILMQDLCTPYLASLVHTPVDQCGGISDHRDLLTGWEFRSWAHAGKKYETYLMTMVIPYPELAHLDAWLSTATLTPAITTDDGFTAYAVTGYVPRNWKITCVIQEQKPQIGWVETPIDLPLSR